MARPSITPGGRGGVFFFVVCLCLAAVTAHAAEVARGDLAIVGLGLEVERNPVITAVDVPSYVQTFFGGKVGAEAPAAPGLSALGDLTGPGIDAPITLSAIPGQKFAIPALHDKGEYVLQNIRLVGANGEFLQQAVPSFATIQVSDVLQTKVKVRQLTPEELRERGIHIDDRNYEVYEYTFIFGVDSQEIEVPYPVVIDKRTREIKPLVPGMFGLLPFPKLRKPPRFAPPAVAPFGLGPGGGFSEGEQRDKEGKATGVTLPAALVVPTGFGVLHQFFAVILQVDNNAPDGSNIRLDSITAKLNSPLAMRVSKVVPAVAIGQPVPVVDERTGATFLVAGAQGSAEWTLEAMKAGTHTLDLEVRATYQKPGQADFGIGGTVSTSIVVSDPRFHVNFSHPDVVRKDDKYTAYAFVTNLSSQRQHIFLDHSDVPKCSTGSTANNVCRYEGEDVVELDIEPGEMVPVPHKLISRVTGKVYAAAGAASDDHVGVSIRLTTGVSQSGIPLSPATLVMPYHTQFLPGEFVDANLQLLGLGYSLATAPLTRFTATKPRVITTDVFRRAQQIALAGQRVFTIKRNLAVNDPLENRDAFHHLSLDLLGNVERLDLETIMPELAEWDELRRQEEAGRIAAAAMARQLEIATTTPSQFVDDFAAATSHRTPFFVAYAHGPPVGGNARPYALSVQGMTTLTSMDVPAEAASGWVRNLSYGELTKFNIGGDTGELAMVGRWAENLRVSVVPAESSFTLHLLYPDTNSGTTLRTNISITNATPGRAVTIDVVRGSRTLIVRNGTATPIVDPVEQAPLRVLGAAQDLHLERGGHVVGLLFNRPITIADTVKFRDLLALTINVAKASYTSTRRNNPADPNAELQIPAAVLQDDRRIVLITFDKTLSKNAAYEIAVERIGDLVKSGVSFSTSGVVPRVDNDAPAAILTGKVLKGDNAPLPGTLVRMQTTEELPERNGFYELVQYDVANADGRYLFEYVPRNLDAELMGHYTLLAEAADGKQAVVNGTARLPGEVHNVNLVFLGRGSAQGQVRWEDGEPIPNWEVKAGSTLFGGTFSAITDANGDYEIQGLPVGPLVFTIVDPDGGWVYATNSIRTAGEVVTQDLIALRKTGPPPGVATVRVLVLRSDTMQPVSGAAVAVGSPLIPLDSAETGSDGRFEFRRVPAGLMSIIAADFSISRHSAAVEVELRADQVHEQTLVLQIVPDEHLAHLTGVITRDDPAHAADLTKDQIVPNAIITIPGLPPITGNADGTYVFPDLPLAASTAHIYVFDPQTGRRGAFRVPTLAEGENRFPMRLTSLTTGRGTFRVRVYGARGEPVAAASVFIPGYPPTYYGGSGGTYELGDILVPQTDQVFAVTSDPNGPYGEQYVQGSTRVEFAGQIGVTDLRLPGLGTVSVKIEVEQPCGTPPCYAQAIGPVSMTYPVWDDYMQKVMPKTIVGDPDPTTNLVTFRNVPAQRKVIFATVRHPAGHAAQEVVLGFEGDVRNVSLRLKTIGNVTGRVLAHDGITPIAGATVRITTGTAIYAPAQTKQDGTWEFAAIPANVDFNVVAELQRDGIFRTGIVYGSTPPGGGPVSDLTIVMREQSSVEGRVVDNVSGAPVPLAHYWLKELAWPYRSIGTALDPLQADINGRFIVGNVFTGPFRVSAVASDNQEIRGHYQGELAEEGDVSQRNVQVRIGDGGVGSISITVVDPLLSFEPVPNAEVSLLRGDGRFDLTTTNDAGVAFFDDVPVGTNYSVYVFSKTRGRSGRSAVFSVLTNQTASTSVSLDFLGVVSGTLTDPDTSPPNQPVRGQPVTYSGSIFLRATSAGDGKFEFNGVPEGPFQLSAWELSTQRIATGPTGLFISKLVPEQRNIQLEMERMGTLTVKVYLPNDTGGPGELAPLVEVTASQCTICHLFTPDYPYYRSAQGSPVVFPRMFRRVGYGLEVRELGGEGRTVGSGGAFPPGAITHEQIIVLPQSGTVEITVVDDNNQPVADAEVQIQGGKLARVFTPPDGRIVLPSVPFGWYSVTARKNNASVAAAGELKSRSQPLRLTLKVGSNVTVTVGGFVEAEQGVNLPSVGTRVILTATSPLLSEPLRLETRTDNDGKFAFNGILVGNTTLSVLYIGPDDNTIGARQPATIPNGTTGTFTLQPRKLDATPPRVLAIEPAANTTNVPPNASMTVTFSEAIAPAFLNAAWFELIATDDGRKLETVNVVGSERPDKTYVVTVTPHSPPAGQTFPLKSNVLYRFVIRDGIQDMTGLKLQTTIGTSFTTVNYTEPAVVRIDPPESEPVPEQVTFRIKFNKAVSLSSFEPGNDGVLKLEKLDAYKGNPVGDPLPISRHLDVVDPTTILVAPTGVAIEESAFYRITVENVRDTQQPPNVQKEPRVFDFFAFDRVKPVVTIVSPVAAGEKLVAGVLYSAGIDVKNANDGSPAKDVAYADWLDAAGVSIAREKTAPYAYSFVAPHTATGTTFTLQATATDLSGNTSDTPASFTWDVAPNAAPTGITVANDVASVYPSGRVESRVRFKDEGVAVTLALELRGTALDGTELRHLIGSRNVTRASTNVEFEEVIFTWNAPLGLKDGSARVIATATDSVNNSATGETPITILLDETPPQIVSFLPRAEARYKFGVNGTLTIEVKAKDAQTGIARAVFTVGGATVLDTATGTFDAATGLTTFRKDVAVPPKNADTRVPIVVTIYDHRDRTVSDTHEVIYERVDDSTLPRAAWITPLDGAALPSNQTGWETTLRVQATDDVKVTAVRFHSTALAAPIELTAPKSGTTDVFEAKAVLAMPADGSSFVITAVVADGDPAHDVELPITVDPVVAAPVITGDINITALTADQYANKSVLVRGNARVYISVPLTLQDLMLVDGAVLSIAEETKLEVTVAGRLFVDADSRVDVSDKGYLGGLRTREDASFTNSSRDGRTLGATTAGGATNADASHGGIGGSYLGTTNATYGSITEPVDFGSGGAAQPGGSTPGANGGGVVILNGDRLVLAGNIHADSSSSGAFWRGGSGGSVNLRARSLVTGARTRITANGSDQDAAANTDAGGGGGRIAIRVTERYDVGDSVLHARGGRNLGAENAGVIDGGAGTIFAQGRLVVSAFDERHPATVHRAAGTPLGGTLAFDAIHAGPRSLVRFDVNIPGNVTADATAMVLSPADVPAVTLASTAPAGGADVPQHTSITANYTASSASGVREVRTILTVQPSDVVAYPGFLTTVPQTASVIAIPSTAPAGGTTLKIRVTDRAGRVAETAPVAFNVVANTAPVIETFNVTPPVEMYAGHDIGIAAAARDDVAVKSLSLTSSTGTITAQAPATPTPQTMTRQFAVTIPPATPSNTNVLLTLSASDDFPGRPATSATHSVLIKEDRLAPSATIVNPTPNQQFHEATGATFVVEVTAADAEVAVKRVTATVEGVEHELTLVAGRWTKSIAVPNVEGSEPVAKTLVVKAYDYEDNAATREVTFFVKPLVDPDAPVLQWTCASPGAMYPAGYEATLRVLATPAKPAHGVQSVEVIVAGGPPIAATRVGTSDSFEAKYTVPVTAIDGTVLDVRVVARSVGGNESTLIGAITAVSGITIASSSTIAAGDLAFENQSLIVASGGVVTVVGPHQLRNVVVLSGGRFLQRPANGLTADLLRVERLYVACGGSADVSSTGFIHNTTYPGAGVSDYGSAGSHIGRAGANYRAAGGAFGSVYEPKEPGGGGNTPNEAEGVGSGIGGGAIRIQAGGTIAIDGSVRANGGGARYGTGAGGSIWLATTSTLGGAGTIEAIGGSSGSAAGGGAIALEYASSSGTFTVDARGGTSSVDGGRNGAAGTIVRRTGGTTSLEVDNKNVLISNTSATELPAFGRATVAAVSGATVTLAERAFVSPSLAGNRVRVYAPDGSVRGTYRIGSVTKHPSTVIENVATVLTQDAVDYSGYLMYSPGGRAGRKYVAVRKNGAQWQFDNDSGFVTFTPTSDEKLFASFTKTAGAFRGLELLRCDAACSVDGLPVLELVSGQIVTDATHWNSPAGPNSFVAAFDAGEIFLHADGDRRAFILTAGAPSVTLESLTGGGVNVQPGDRLRGVYNFDSIKLTNARVESDDLIEAPLQKDALSSLTGGNLAPPVIDATKVTIAHGLNGPVLIGAAGAVADPDGALEIASRNAAQPATEPAVIRGDNFIGVGTAGGLSIFHLENRLNGGGARAMRRIEGEGYVSFSPSQTTTNVQAGLVPDDTGPQYNEPGHNSFRLLSNATYEVWANGANANRNGAYTTGTAFRIEKTANALRWYVDEAKVHEVATGVPASLVFDVSFEQGSSGELRSIQYATTTRAFTARVAANGSFRVPVRGAAGDPVHVRATDRHADPFTSAEVLAGVIPAGGGVASLTFAPAEVTGGRTAVGTVTLVSPAGSEGAVVELERDNSVVTIPGSITIAAGMSSDTFNAATTAVANATDVNVRATYGGAGTASMLRVVKDLIAPTVTVTAPAPNSEYTEGQTAKIQVRATAADEDSGVKRVWATFEGQTYPMTLAAAVWSAQIPVPLVDGSQNVTKEIVVSAEDNTGNIGNAAPVPVVIRPLNDSAPPSIAWSCGTAGAILPVGYNAPLRVIATPPNADNYVQKVELTITGPSGVPATFAATDKGSGLYEVLFTVPDVADGSAFNVRATATTISGTSAFADSSFQVIKGATEIRTNTTINAANTTFDGQSVVIWEGVTVTIDGPHTFQRLVVLGTLTHPVLNSIDVTATAAYVACGAAINVTGLGYNSATRYPGVPNIPGGDGGSHIGRGGLVGESGFTYGSVYRPMEAGTGGSSGNSRGGGVVKLFATSLVVDGAITAAGSSDPGFGAAVGAGGSLWINTGRIGGRGTISANGGNACQAGGGGAIAIEYTDATSVLPALSARSGQGVGNSCGGIAGGPGTIRVAGPGSNHGSVTIDSAGMGTGTTELPALGSGLALSGSSGATLVTDRGAGIPAFFARHWVRITDANGNVRGTWRIATIDTKTVTLTPNGAEAIDISVGDRWQGIYRFDKLTVSGGVELLSIDPIETAEQTISGPLTASSIVTDRLHLASGAALKHPVGGALAINVSGELRIDTGATIDLTGLGYNSASRYPGVPAPPGGDAGSHIGRGGLVGETGYTYGSVYRPNEAGAGGSSGNSRGGGVARIIAGSVIVDGAIIASGSSDPGFGAAVGAGGSVWITTGRISGTGAISANGGQGCQSGGGGAIAIEYTDATSVVPTLFARAGQAVGNSCGGVAGGPGTIRVAGPSATHGDITIDSAGMGFGTTELPSFGSGFALNGSSGATLVTDRAATIQPFFKGHWVRITDANGNVRGTWRIATIDVKTVTLAPNGVESISIAAGDRWQGIYRFDKLAVSGGVDLLSSDPIETAEQTLSGALTTSLIKTDKLRLLAGTTLKHPVGGALNVTVTGELRIDAGATIDLTGLGYNSASRYPGVPAPPGGDAGSHIGRGGAVGETGYTYGSVYRPNEAGAGGSSGTSRGGGVARIVAGSVIVDGAIAASGSNDSGFGAAVGAGGSVWITTGRISGTGTISANGGNACQSGGGGAVAIEYTDATSVMPTLFARAGQGVGNSCHGVVGGPGTIRVAGPTATHGDFTIDSANMGTGTTELPSFGSGFALNGSSGATLVTDRAANIQPFFAGHWVRITDANGNVRGTWRIATIDVRTVTLAPNGAESISIAVGDRWQGIYRFDKLTIARGVELLSADPIESAEQVVSGPLTTSTIKTDKLHLLSSTALKHPLGGALNINVTGELRIDNGATIDVTALGNNSAVRYPGVPAPPGGDAGSHIGRGGAVGENGYTYGSVARPNEAGAGGSSGTSRGGGVVRIIAGSVIVDGTIAASGSNDPGFGAAVGSGGSVWITTGKITGTGTISANGGQACQSGGGGAVAIEYTDATSVPPTSIARAGQAAGNSCHGVVGGPGTVRIAGPAATHGNVTIDSAGMGTGTTELPAFGIGLALNGSNGATLVTDRAANIQPFFVGHWVEIRSAAGTVKGVWRIGTVNVKTVTLVPNASESISIVPGDTWEGIYHFDVLKLRAVTLLSADPLRYATLDKDAASTVMSNAAAPVFDPALASQIAVESTPTADFVTGPAGAVTDPDQPIRVTATNVRTGLSFSANANANGSFRVPVEGMHGDTFTLRATDGHTLPRSSTASVNGAIVDPNSIASFVINPSTVNGGTRASGTIRLTHPARPGGISIALTSSNVPRASVPASIAIPAGASGAQFAIDTTAAAANDSATITATYTNVKSAVVTVTSTANAVATLTLDTPVTEGGTSVNATVTLGAAAGAGGALVLLSSSDTSRATVPDTALVPEGLTSATFTVTTMRVGVSSDVTIYATWGTTKAAPLTLSACASIGVASPAATTPATIWFDDALPAGATATGDAAFAATQAASGTQSIHFASAAGARTWSFSGAAPLTVGPGDMLELYALVNPCNPPRQIAVTWSGGATLKATWGEAQIERGTQKQIGAVPAGGTWVRFSVLAKSLGVTASTNLTGLSIAVYGGEAWFDLGGSTACSLGTAARPERHPYERIWFDDDAPAGATLFAQDDATRVAWQWTTAQAAVGTRSQFVKQRDGGHQSYLQNATEKMRVGMGDLVFAYALLDPCNPPRQVMLELYDGSTWTRAFWGEDLIPWADQRFNINMGPLPAAGQWVRLEVPASLLMLDLDNVDHMSFSLFDGAAWFDAVGTIPRVNLALNKTADQSTDLNTVDLPSKANDGNVATFQHTNAQSQPWWDVDLGTTQAIDTISVWNRADCCQNRTVNFWVLVSDAPITSETLSGARNEPGVRAYHYVPQAGFPVTFRVHQPGRYVRLQLESTFQYLSFGELQVWAPANPQRINHAGGSPGTSQASPFDGATSERAVDGRTAGFYDTERSTSHTDNTAQSWWEIDLGSVQPISRIDLHNQVPGADRLRDFFVFVSDTPFTSKVIATTIAQSGVSTYYHSTPMRIGNSFEINRSGRFVRVQLSGTNYLVLAEVQIWSRSLLLKSLARPVLDTTQ